MSFPGYYFFVREDLMIHKQNISLLKVFIAAEHKDDVTICFIIFLSLCNLNVCLLIVFAKNDDLVKVSESKKIWDLFALS